MDFCVWGCGGKGGIFVIEVLLFVEEFILFGLNEFCRVFGFGLDVFIGGWDGELNVIEFDLVFVFIFF